MKYTIEETALNQLFGVLNEMPYKYSVAIIKVLEQSLKAEEEDKE